MIRLSHEPQASPDEVAFIENAINQYNMQVTGYRTYTPVHIFLRNEDNEIMGGVTSGIWGGWLQIYFLWIHEALRQQGYGSQLMAAIETHATTHGCRGIYLETYDFQARDFYLKQGYTIVGEVQDYPVGHISHSMTKILNPS